VYLRPLSGPIGFDSQPFHPGQIPQDPRTWGLNPHTNLEVVTPGYFRTMGIRLVRGRLFTERDTGTSPGVVIVSESAARRLWPRREAIGQRLRDPAYLQQKAEPPLQWQSVVGIVEDVRYPGLNDVRLDLYLPATQSTNHVQQVMVRTREAPAEVAAAVRAIARALDPAASVSEATIMSEVVEAESAPWRFLMRVFVAFAVLGATLAAIGLTAVVTFAVATRRRELAIRAALGAGPGQLRTVVVREALWLIAVGSGLGLLGALALGRGAASLLIGVAPHDARALGVAVCLTVAVGLVASWLPARRAAEANPIEALRAE
jgi:putative ABC transport system permease protein